MVMSTIIASTVIRMITTTNFRRIITMMAITIAITTIIETVL